MCLLALRDPVCEVTGFERPNLFFDVLEPPDKMRKLCELVAQRLGKSGIVYCATRKTCEQVCEGLRCAGFGTVCYHAGLSGDERRKSQDDFVYDHAQVIVATNAFGMGIDKSNVSFVIHYNMPKSIEAYYQEAGRDGKSADCILLYSPQDVIIARFLIEHSGSDEIDGETQAEVKRKTWSASALWKGTATRPAALGCIFFATSERRRTGARAALAETAKLLCARRKTLRARLK